jgi:preprotein translocase SecE subunit
MASPLHYFRESLAELRRVTWPSQKTVVAHTILVVIISVVLMVILSAFDFGLGSAYSWIIRTLAL